jgi:hypothetical protein
MFRAARSRVQKKKKRGAGIRRGRKYIQWEVYNFGFGLWLHFLFIPERNWDESGLGLLFLLFVLLQDIYKESVARLKAQCSKEWRKSCAHHITLSFIRGLIRDPKQQTTHCWMHVWVCVFVEANLSHSAVQKQTWLPGDTHGAIDPTPSSSSSSNYSATMAHAMRKRKKRWRKKRDDVWISTLFSAVECGLSLSDSVTVTDDSGGRTHSM